MSIPIRILTATAIFDGHDASINIMRRVLQENGAEIIHLGHNHSVDDIINAAIQEDVNAIAISSYQGGHIEYFKYLVDQIYHFTGSEKSILVFGGGGGTIGEDDAKKLERYGVTKIYTSEQGLELGLEGMANDVLKICREKQKTTSSRTRNSDKFYYYDLAKRISSIEQGSNIATLTSSSSRQLKVIGITGTGGSGKSTFIDELLKSLLELPQSLNIVYLAIDPTRQKSGGALLGDRLRINCQNHERLFMRSIATRTEHVSVSPLLSNIIKLFDTGNFDLLLIETAGIGQSDTSIVEIVDSSYYVMTKDYGAPSQLEKIEMLDHADKVILNKCDLIGSEDAYHDICVQWKRNHKEKEVTLIPVFPMIANNFDDDGLKLCIDIISRDLGYLDKIKFSTFNWNDKRKSLIPNTRINYLSEIAMAATNLTDYNLEQLNIIFKIECYFISLDEMLSGVVGEKLKLFEKCSNIKNIKDESFKKLSEAYNSELKDLDKNYLHLLKSWPKKYSEIHNNRIKIKLHDKTIEQSNYQTTLSDLSIPLIATPKFNNQSELLEFLLNENVSGTFPFTAGVFPYRSVAEEPTRMFAGEGVPEDTNKRFFYLSKDRSSIRLSTAFDPITLYGQDPDMKPDNFGCIGMSGVSIATQDDMKKLYSGINLSNPKTSVSMTINGPANILLAWFFNAAIDQQVEMYLKNTGDWHKAERKIRLFFNNKKQPQYIGELPDGHNGLGLALLGISGQELVGKETYEKIKKDTLINIRGTLQADILKEEIAQNECIFSLPFGLRLMADIQDYFINYKVNKFYSVSVSGYHIAEAGANPITQLAFTLANGFTLVEYYLARGMKVDNFASHFSFFFSNGMDPEYAVIGRVARRIWARAMRYRYYANTTSQKLKYHIQTSGRSLHTQDIELNDVRTTLQALYAIYDNCNSLHTNAYDEAVTTPTEESVHRALAIQMIIDKELGMNINQNPLQGSYFIKELTDKVEREVYKEFIRISNRGGVIAALESFYQQNKIQSESRLYETKRNDGSISIVGVNTFISNSGNSKIKKDKISHSSSEKKQQQVNNLNLFLLNNIDVSVQALEKLNESIRLNKNSFEVLMDVSRYCSLGQITQELITVGGQYRRKM